MTHTFEIWRKRGVILVTREGNAGTAGLRGCLAALERLPDWPPARGLIFDHRRLTAPAGFDWRVCADEFRSFGIRWGTPLAFLVRSDEQLASTVRLCMLLVGAVPSRVCLSIEEAIAWMGAPTHPGQEPSEA